MNEPEQLLSRRQLIGAVILALLAGVLLTVGVILPAERALQPGRPDNPGVPGPPGDAQAVAAEAAGIAHEALYIGIDPATTAAVVDEFGDPQPVVTGANLRQHDTPYRTEAIEIRLDTDASVEYKAIMEQAEVLLYAWQADGEVYYDFHAHQQDGNADFFTRYAEGEGVSDRGSIVAPYAGQHGWFWLNIAGRPVTVRLTVAGYHDALLEIDPASE